jgi:hypothetical protein
MDGSVAVYLCSVRRYRTYLQARGYDEIERLTYAAVASPLGRSDPAPLSRTDPPIDHR